LFFIDDGADKPALEITVDDRYEDDALGSDDGEASGSESDPSHSEAESSSSRLSLPPPTHLLYLSPHLAFESCVMHPQNLRFQVENTRHACGGNLSA
jgi:hypothetical protein